jgi:hypothetical protein
LPERPDRLVVALEPVERAPGVEGQTRAAVALERLAEHAVRLGILALVVEPLAAVDRGARERDHG